jgi:hypothetical protein
MPKKTKVSSEVIEPAEEAVQKARTRSDSDLPECSELNLAGISRDSGDPAS